MAWVRPAPTGGGKMIRTLTLLNSPGIQWHTAAPRQPYNLPDAGQNFTTAQLTFLFAPKASAIELTTPNAIYIVLLGLWAVDANGADIEQIFTGQNTSLGPYNGWDGRLWPFGIWPLTGTLHGGNFWAAHVGQNVRTVRGSPYDQPGWTQPNRIITASMPVCGFRTAINMYNDYSTPGGTVAGSVALPARMQGVIQELT